MLLIRLSRVSKQGRRSSQANYRDDGDDHILVRQMAHKRGKENDALTADDIGDGSP